MEGVLHVTAITLGSEPVHIASARLLVRSQPKGALNIAGKDIHVDDEMKEEVDDGPLDGGDSACEW